MTILQAVQEGRQADASALMRHHLTQASQAAQQAGRARRQFQTAVPATNCK
jgi:DNA-binding FadR family transcriptional regulator